jgi:hypothetical protein
MFHTPFIKETLSILLQSTLAGLDAEFLKSLPQDLQADVRFEAPHIHAISHAPFWDPLGN